MVVLCHERSGGLYREFRLLYACFKLLTMATRKRQGSTEQIEKLRKVTKVTSPPLNCPLCDVTLRPDTINTHYQQELQRVQAPPTSSRRKKSNQGVGGATNARSCSSSEQTVTERAQTVLDSVRRRRFRFDHTHSDQSSSQPGPSHQTSSSTCPVCDARLPADEEAASAHVASCLHDNGDSSDSEDVTYEEYTWCDVTRVRATSLLSPEARANLFNGTVITSAADTSVDVDVEEDDTDTYGPAQFTEKDVQECGQSESGHVTDTEGSEPEGGVPSTAHRDGSSAQCLVCMSPYVEPLVSVLCWHVYCEKCWLQALKAKKLCPKCKRITCAGDLRRIFL